MSRRREIILYIFFGGVAFLLNVALFMLFSSFMNVLVSNVLCWIMCVAVQFVTHKFFVFMVKADSMKELFIEIVMFFGGRVITLIVEELILAIFITWLHFNALVIKLFAMVVIIILNYIVSKRFVFNGG